MCKWHGGTYEGNVPVRLAGGGEAAVDPCIQGLVQAINDGGFRTSNSCCGHGQRPGWVALAGGRHILIAADHAMMRQMDAGFPALTMFTKEEFSAMPKDMTWDKFEQRLIDAGWSPKDAKAERQANEHGDLGDCDGDLDPWA